MRNPRLSELVARCVAFARKAGQGLKWKGWLFSDAMKPQSVRRLSPPTFVDYREQAPLDLNVTAELARSLGVRHPQRSPAARPAGLVADMLVLTKDAVYVCDAKWPKAVDAPGKDGGSHG